MDLKVGEERQLHAGDRATSEQSRVGDYQFRRVLREVGRHAEEVPVALLGRGGSRHEAANPFPFFPSIDGAPWNPVRGTPVFRRITIDLASDEESVRDEVLFDGQPVSDLARIDPRRSGLPFRYAFTAFSDARRIDTAHIGQPRRPVQNCYGMFDLLTDSFESVFAGPTHTLSEPIRDHGLKNYPPLLGPSVRARGRLRGQDL